MIWPGSSGTALIVGIIGSAVLVLLAVLMMRYDHILVIGGQEISKTASGLVAYQACIGHSDDLVIGDGPTVAAVGGGSSLID